jgi:hypothetical protein
LDCSKDSILWGATRASQRKTEGENMEGRKLEEELKFYISKKNKKR